MQQTLEMDISVQRHARAHNKMNTREKSNLFVSVQEAQQFEKHTRVRFHVCAEIVAGGGQTWVNENSESYEARTIDQQR